MTPARSSSALGTVNPQCRMKLSLPELGQRPAGGLDKKNVSFDPGLTWEGVD